MEASTGGGIAANGEDDALRRAATKVAWDAYDRMLADSTADARVEPLEPTHIEGDSRILLSPASGHILFNRALAARPEVVPLAASVFRRHRVPQFLISVPRAQQREALRLGRVCGLLRFRRPWALMARWVDRVGGPQPAVSLDTFEAAGGTEIRPIQPSEADRAAALLCREFGMPETAAPVWAVAGSSADFELLGAWCDGCLVGVGAIYIDSFAAYLAGGVVSPAYRRRGIQRALLRARVDLAIDRGVRALVSETGLPMGSEPNPSFRNLRAIGLRVIDVTEHLCPPGTSW